MNEQPTKTVVSVSEMARMVGLSRSRFYQLLGAAFPHPQRDPETGRPFYDEDGQRTCLEVRRRNQGIDGQPILFYARRPTPPSRPRTNRLPKAASAKTTGPAAAVLEGVRALGLASVTAGQVQKAIREQFPDGTADVEQAEVVRSVFVSLMRQNPTDSVGR